MIIFELICPLLNWASFLEAAGAVSKIGLSLKPNHHRESGPNPCNDLSINLFVEAIDYW